MTITLSNDFHGTKISLRVGGDGSLNSRQIKKAKKALCCTDCTCSGPIGIRGRQDGFEIIEISYGKFYVEPS